MVSDKEKRRTLEWEIRSGLRRMQRVLGDPLPAELAIVAQQVIQTDRQLAGCYQVGQRADGSRFALVRLALQMNGQPLSVDELLAVLVEQCIGLATEQDGVASVLVPVDLNLAQASAARQSATLQPDPLMPHRNGTAAHEHTT